MRVAFGSFENELEQLRGFLEAREAEDRLFAAMFRRMETVHGSVRQALEVVEQFSTAKRRQSYVSSIIVLYAALERYVEEAVEEYTQSLVRIHQSYRDLPQKLRDRHTSLTIEYLALLKEGKVRKTEEVNAIVGALNDCLSGADGYRLNARAFWARSGNMRLARIREIMKNLDVELPDGRVLAMPAYGAYLSDARGLATADADQAEVKATLDHIDELVDLRNDIAHGVADFSAIEDPGIVREREQKLSAFVAAVNEILDCELMSARIGADQLVRVEGEVQVFGRDVACFHWPSGPLAVGDILVMRPASSTADLRHGEIRSIEIDGSGYEGVEGSDGLLIGVQVPFRVKANGEFYVWSGAA